MKILVTGASGTLGSEILLASRRAKIGLRLLTRRRPKSDDVGEMEWVQADLATGDGLPNAVTGTEVIIHAATDSRNSEAVDVVGTRRLVEAAASAGVRHLVYVSIVGVDQISFAYYQRKLVAEKIVTGGNVPYSILRATQFHSLIDMFITRAARVPFVVPLPTRFLIQSVAGTDVARRLLQCLKDGPQGRLPDLVGPEVMTLGDAAAVWKEVRGVRRKIVGLPLPGAMAAAFRAGKNTNPNGIPGSISWRDWLTGRSDA